MKTKIWLVSLLCWLLFTSSAFAIDYSIKKINQETTPTGWLVKIDNGQLVWPTENALYFYNGETIISIPKAQYSFNFDISNGQLSWEDLGKIFVYTASGETRELNFGTYYAPVIDNEYVVGFGEDQNGKSLWMHNITTMTDKRIALTPDILPYISVDDEQVAYYSYDNLDWQYDYALSTLCFYDGVQSHKILTSQDILLYLHLDNGKIAWYQRDPDVSGSVVGDYFVWDGRQVTNVTPDEQLPANPIQRFFHNGKLVYYKDDGNDYELFVYDMTTRETTQITDNEFDDLYPEIHNNQIVWQGYDETDGYVVLLYDCTTQITSKIGKCSSAYPKIHDGQITWSNWNGSSYDIYMASPTLSAYNVGDGESIRLEWPAYRDSDKKIHYDVYRKAEDPERDWEETDKINSDPIGNPKEGTIIEFPDDALSGKSSSPPERGIVYDYKIEVYENNNTTPVRTLDGKKGVTEPFIMLVRGYGEDDQNYWNDYRQYLELKKFRISIQSDENNNELPQTLYDVGSFPHEYIYHEKENEDPESENPNDPEYYHAGQLNAEQTAKALLKEFTGTEEEVDGETRTYWLDDIRKCNRYENDDPTQPLILDWVPEHFYIISHSMGAAYSRRLEKKINAKNEEWFDNGKSRENYIPYVQKNIMLSPLNMGCSLARELRNAWLPKQKFAELATGNDPDWPSTYFAMPETIAQFNFDTPPSARTKYHLVGSNSWYNGGGGRPEENEFKRIWQLLKYFYSWYRLNRTEGSLLPNSSPYLQNDGTITLQMQWGLMTDKVWSRVQKKQGINADKTAYEFIPGQGQAFFYQPYFLNHIPGMVYDTTNVTKDKAWECLDIPPRN